MALPGITAVTNLNALESLLLGRGTSGSSALATLVGQDLELLLQAAGPEGVQLQLPSGQSILAQGQLPYPQGTQLLVRVLPASNESGFRLQPLEARPPAPSPILAPLLQGEASSLLGRLSQPEPPQELLPLMHLLNLLAETSPATQVPLSLPAFPRLEASLRALPQGQLADLGKVLGSSPQASPAQLAEDLEHWLQAAVKDKAPAQTDAAALQQAMQTLVGSHPELPKAQGDALLALLRNLLTGSQTQEKAATPNKEFVSRLPAAEAAPTSGPANASGQRAAAAQPENWEGWVKGSMKALSDPASSPREAPFHIAQSREGTGFFEIPVPWTQGGSLQLWVERDAQEQGAQRPESVQRVLLGLNFSQLGETRLGLAKGAFGLQVRIWSEHAELLQPERERMEAELRALGSAVDLQIQSLPAGSPSLRALVTGPSLQALG